MIKAAIVPPKGELRANEITKVFAITREEWK